MNKIINPKVLTKKILDYLDKNHGLKPKAIAKITGLDYEQIRSVKNRGSGGTLEMVNTLLESYPELVQEFELEVKNKDESEIKERIKKLETDNQLLKEMMIKMLEDRGDKDKAEEIKKLI